MSLPPAVIVHGLGHVRAALGVGARVTLLSAPGAASYAGCGWWRALVRRARNVVPDSNFLDLLDCGDASGRALAALRIGQKLIVLTPAAPGWDAVSAIARAQDGAVFPLPPPALDLGNPDAARQLHDWLQVRTASGDSGPGVG